MHHQLKEIADIYHVNEYYDEEYKTLNAEIF